MSASRDMNVEIVDGIANSLAQYLYTLADMVHGDNDREPIYLDAAESLMDVIALWAADEMAVA